MKSRQGMKQNDVTQLQRDIEYRYIYIEFEFIPESGI